MRRFCSDHLDHRFAARRRPPGTAPIEALGHVADAKAPSPAAELDRGWIDVAVAHALATLRAHNADYGEVVADLLRTDGEGSADLGARLGRTEQQLVHLRHRARRRFAVLFHDQLRETVRDEEAFGLLARRLEPYLP